MGCCENINNLVKNKNKDLSSSYNSKEIIDKDYIIVDNEKSILGDNKIVSSLFKRNEILKKQPYHKQNQILDKINEVESEYKESSILLTRDKASPHNKFKVFENLIKNNSNKRNFCIIKNLRKKRSQSKHKKILSDDIFNKKIKEYSNMSVNYQLTRKTDSKNNSIKGKSIENISFKDYNFNVVTENNRRRLNRNVKYKFLNESFDNIDKNL